MMDRRLFLTGLAGILAAGSAPAIVASPMRVRVLAPVDGLVPYPMTFSWSSLPPATLDAWSRDMLRAAQEQRGLWFQRRVEDLMLARLSA